MKKPSFFLGSLGRFLTLSGPGFSEHPQAEGGLN